MAKETTILIIDNYDSYTRNLRLLCEKIGVQSVVICNNQMTIEQLDNVLDRFDGIIVSPGPGSPHHPQDIGISSHVLSYSHLPVLGVCLGHQALAHSEGATIVKAKQPKHGIVDKVTHDGTDLLFKNIPRTFDVVRYHSLVIDPTTLGKTLQVTAQTDDGEIMAIKHLQKPMWGVQFHPESICTAFGEVLLSNFAQFCQSFSESRVSEPVSCPLSFLKELDRVPRPLLSSSSIQSTLSSTVTVRIIENAHLSAQELIKSVKDPSRFIWLDSAKMQSNSRFSYLCDTAHPSTRRFEYHLSSKTVSIFKNNSSQLLEKVSVSSFYPFLSVHLQSHALHPHSTSIQGDITSLNDIPFDFLGGLVGYIGYEMKTESFCAERQDFHATSSTNEKQDAPDGLMWNIERAIVFDHIEKKVYLMAIDRENPVQGERWMQDMLSIITTPVKKKSQKNTPLPPIHASYHHKKENYINMIKAAQAHIVEGDTYQVCLTTPVHVSIPTTEQSPWIDYYSNLRQKNPALFGMYMETPSLALLSSSPELFMKINRKGVIQMKPIKGTVARVTAADCPDISLRAQLDDERAESLRLDTKNRAENLMIVDLIRNDLHLISEPDTVRVPSLMHIESYATVHQLVTEVQGQLRPDLDAVDAIHATFPPGSMTGAPKISTVKILEELEGCNRGVYSGVMGYFSYLMPCMKMSVVIRTMVIQKNHMDELGQVKGYVGAGGAITHLSDPMDEWHEMELKANAVLGAFR